MARRRPPARWGGFAGWALMLPAVAVVIIFFAVPVVLLSARSFLEPEPGFGQYVQLFSDKTSITILIRTIVVALLVTVVTLLLSYPYAYLMSITSPRVRALLLFLVLLPFWSSLMARSFAWIVLLQPQGPVAGALRAIGLEGIPLLGSQVGVTIAMAQVLLPFMVLPLSNSMAQIDRNLLSAAYSMGASRIRAFVKVYLPLSLPGVTAGAVLVFILSLGFWVTPRLIGSPQQSLIGQFIQTKVGTLLDFAGAGALSVVLLVTTGILLAVAGGAARRTISTGGGSRDE